MIKGRKDNYFVLTKEGPNRIKNSVLIRLSFNEYSSLCLFFPDCKGRVARQFFRST